MLPPPLSRPAQSLPSSYWLSAGTPKAPSSQSLRLLTSSQVTGRIPPSPSVYPVLSTIPSLPSLPLPVLSPAATEPALPCTWPFADMLSISLGAVQISPSGAAGSLLRDDNSQPGMLTRKMRPQVRAGPSCAWAPPPLDIAPVPLPGGMTIVMVSLICRYIKRARRLTLLIGISRHPAIQHPMERRILGKKTR